MSYRVNLDKVTTENNNSTAIEVHGIQPRDQV